MVVELPAYEVIVQLIRGINPEETARWCTEAYQLPPDHSTRFVNEIRQLIEKETSESSIAFVSRYPHTIPEKFHSRKLYLIAGVVYSFDYGNSVLEHLIHPKFAYLEIAEDRPSEHYFRVFMNDLDYVLSVNGTLVGQWPQESAHYFTGKISMELLNQMYHRAEHDWMGVFHASAISFGERCMMFLGESGNGKSTVSAILMASGFNLLADDIVPVEAISGEVFYFPAAVSVKKKAIGSLIPFFPQLGSAKEFYYPGSDKTVRYLAPLHQVENQNFRFPCKALVFVKYKKGSGLKLEKMDSDIAFSELVPDSWISPLEENASSFLDWFLSLPCYRLTYSDNAAMVEAIKKLFHDEA